jgi:hypothetical protein
MQLVPSMQGTGVRCVSRMLLDATTTHAFVSLLAIPPLPQSLVRASQSADERKTQRSRVMVHRYRLQRGPARSALAGVARARYYSPVMPPSNALRGALQNARPNALPNEPTRRISRRLGQNRWHASPNAFGSIPRLRRHIMLELSN